LTALAFPTNIFAQNFSSISGKVIDAKTKETLPGATVFLASTTIGVSASETGDFTLAKIPPGKYDLTVSMVGYTSYTKPILFSGGILESLVIGLTPSSIQLNAVTVEARREKQNRHYYSQFENGFLGITQNSNRCKILNPFDIFVYKDGDKIIALASKPIIVENKALGYKIHYELEEFKISKLGHSFSMAGTPRFEELTPESEKQKQKWIRERDRAYFGSIEHFLISLRANALYSNYFEVRDARGNLITMKQEIMKDSLIAIKGSIFVTYLYENPELGFSRRGNSQESEIKFYGQPVTVYPNGYFEDYHSLIFLGYMGWSSNIAEMLPLGYHPTHSLKRK
jgi:hypothetical protein